MSGMETRALALALAALAACGGRSGGDPPPPPTPSITVTPANPSTTAGGDAVQLTATLSNVAGTVVWSIETAGSDVGSITQAGLYTPPASLAVAKDVVVKAAVAAVAAVSGTATVRLTPAAPGATLAITTARPLEAVVAGSGATRAVHVETSADPADVSWTLGPALGTLSATSGADVIWTAPSQLVTEPTPVTITAALASPALQDSITVMVNPTPLALSGPTTVKTAGGTAQYAVTTAIGGATVAWALVPADGTVGTISPAGLYTAPSTLSGPARTFEVVASVGQATGSLTVTLEPAAIALSAPSATVASGGTLAFTATVDPPAAASQLAWTVEGGGGTIAPTGNPATYTAPVVVNDTAVTIRASAAGASAAATVRVLAAGAAFDVTGTVVAADGVTPVAGAEVFLGAPGGPHVTTLADGAFTFSTLERPYALVAVAPGGRHVRVFDGLTVASPVVNVRSGAGPHGAELTGVVRQGEDPVEAFVSSDLAEGNQQLSDPLTGAYVLWLDWYGSTPRGGTLRAIRTKLGVNGEPVSYRYGTAAFTATASGSATADVSLVETPPTGTISGTLLAPPPGFDHLRATYVTAFGPTDWLASFDLPLGVTAFSFVVPDLPGKAMDLVRVSASSASSRSEHAVRAAPGTSGIAISLPAPPTYTAPPNGATIGYGTSLQWTAPPGGSSRVYVECNGGTALATRYEIVTAGTSTRIPELSSVGVDPSGSCTWSVDWQSDSVDWTLREDYTELQETRYVWGDGYGSVTFAP